MKEFLLIPKAEYEAILKRELAEKKFDSCTGANLVNKDSEKHTSTPIVKEFPEEENLKKQSKEVLFSNSVNNETILKIYDKLNRLERQALEKRESVNKKQGVKMKRILPIYNQSTPKESRTTGMHLVNDLLERDIIQIDPDGVITIETTPFSINVEDLLRSIFVKRASIQGNEEILHALKPHIPPELIRNEKLKGLYFSGAGKKIKQKVIRKKILKQYPSPLRNNGAWVRYR